MPTSPPKLKVGLISLGCPKNLVDSEVMLGLLREDGCELVKDEREADVMVINTCAFIEDSEKESLDTIREIAQLKKTGDLKKLIVTGCLPQRYKRELETKLPDVDHFLGTGDFQRIAEFTRPGNGLPVAKSVIRRPEYLYDHATPRISTLPGHTVYVKIAEGCSRTCSFCTIPRLRGRGRSRTVDSILREVRLHREAGVLEVNLISQDLTAYGLDLGDRTGLEKLLGELVRIEGLRWIRLLYNYPIGFTDGLIDRIVSEEKICKYVDLPLQHIDGELLESMQRKVDEKETRGLIERLRRAIPGLTLRTALIVGFPGETEKQFRKLEDFVRETEFERLGVFTYSAEEGTVAATLPGQIPADVKAGRRDRIMRLQQGISLKKNRALIGAEIDVLVDRTMDGSNGIDAVGRTEGQAPDIDGSVFLKGKNIRSGELLTARVTDAAEYDLFAEPL